MRSLTMVQQQYKGSNPAPNIGKYRNPKGELPVTDEAIGPNFIPVRTRDNGVGATIFVEAGAVSTGPCASNTEVVTSFQISQSTKVLAGGQDTSVITKKKPPLPPPKPDTRKTQTMSVKPDVRIVTKEVSSDMSTENLKMADSKRFKSTSDITTPSLARINTSQSAQDVIRQITQGTTSLQSTEVCHALENAEVLTKFPNSFVATKRKKSLPRSHTPSSRTGYHVSQSSVLSNTSDSSIESGGSSSLFESEEGVTSFQTIENVEALPLAAFNRSLGHQFSRLSMSSTISSSSTNSSRSSGIAGMSPLLLKAYPGSSYGNSSMLLSQSSLSLSSSSSHGISSLDVSSSCLSVPESRCASSIPEVPEYDEVNSSSCDKCSEGKCRTVYLHMTELPFGWEKVEDPHYGVYYIDHVNRRTQYENPAHSIKNQSGVEVTNTFPRHKKTSEGSTKRSASETNMQGQVFPQNGRQFFTKDPGELKGEFTQTSLVKSARGLGFTIIGGNQRDTQFLQIKNVVENGPAHISGKFRAGDVIVQVNNTCVLGFTHQDVVRLFQSIVPGQTVQLETCRGYPLNFDPDDPNTEIVTTVAVTLPHYEVTSNGQSTTTNSPNMDTVHVHGMQAGVKAMPDLTRSAVGQGHNNAYSFYPSNNHQETGMNPMLNQDNTIPDLVSLSINGRPEMLTIPLVKGPMGFGFTIADSPYGQRVKQILDQSRCQNLAEGDLILLINSVNVRELLHQQTVQLLKDCKQDQETVIVVQRRGIPPVPGKAKKNIQMSRSFEQQVENSSLPPGPHFFQSQDQIFNDQEPDNCAANNGVRVDTDSVGVVSSLPPPIAEADEEGDDVDGEKLPNKTPFQDTQRPKTPLEGNRATTTTTVPAPSSKVGSPRQQPYMEMHVGRRDYQDSNEFSKFNSNHPRADIEGNSMGRPPRGPSRPDFFPRFDPRLRSGDSRGDPFQRSMLSMQAHAGVGDERWGHGRDVKPGQFRSRTPGPELMARGPDSAKPDTHRPKTPTAADMRSNGKSMTSFGTGDFKTSGRFTPNPSSEQGRQYKSPYQDPHRNWPDFPIPPPHANYEPFDNSSLNRSYAGEFPRPAFQNSLGPGRPMRQSTSFESDKPAPSTITRLPRKPPPHPAFHGLPPMPQSRVVTDENGVQVMEMLVTLHRQESGYGFRIIGGTEESSQVSVGHIVHGGAADLDGRLHQNDEITHVDGCSVLSASHHRVVELMTNAALNGRVTLSIKRILGQDPQTNEIAPQYPYDVVVSRRENEGFGFVIISSVNKSGASVDEFIGHIQENSPASRCGRLHVGDRILAVNGVDTSNMHHKDVVSLIKDSGFSVALTIGPPPDDNSSTSQKSSEGFGANTTIYPADKPDLNIQSWERNQPGLSRDNGRPRALSNKSSEENGEIYQVELSRGSRGFGFSIRGGREFNSMPLYVLRIAEGGAADLDGRLRVGDQILEINGFNTESMTHTEAIEIIQNGGLSVKLFMRRTNKPPPIFEGSPASPSNLTTSGNFLPNIPPVVNGPISHSSPHMNRRQLQHQQPLPPPPPELQLPNNDYFNYPPPPSAAQTSLPQPPRQRFHNY